MVELKCGTKIEWMDSFSLSLKKGIIIKDGIRIDSYMVAELDTGLIYDVGKKDITLVMVDGEWIGYSYLSSGYPRRSSGRYPWGVDVAANVIKNYIDNDRKAVYDLIKSYRYEPKKVIFNGPATIVIWKDGAKTIVKRREGEPDDKEKAVMYCILKKLCSSKAEMDRYLKLFIKEESNDEEKEETGGSKSDWKKPRAGSGSSEGDL